MKKYEIGITFGSINPIHYGHILFLIKAKKYVKKLYFGLDSDNYLINVKKKELYQPFKERYKILNEIKSIDLIFTQSYDKNKEYWINHFNPNVILVGDDHKDKNWEGEIVSKKYSIPIIYINHTKEIHSEYIRRLIKETDKNENK